MKLQWKYALIINVSVLVILGTFYLINDFASQRDLRRLHLRNVENGAMLRQIADRIRIQVEQEIERQQGFHQPKIEEILRQIKSTASEMTHVVDINVTDGVNAKIAASLVAGKTPAHLMNFTEIDLFEIQRKAMQVYNMVELPEKGYGSEIIVPYRVDWLNEYSDENTISGVIQVLFSSPDINHYIQSIRWRHLWAIIATILLLCLVIVVTTVQLVLRPLEQLTQIVRFAEADDLSSLQLSYQAGDIGEATFALVRMLKELKASHQKRLDALGQFAAGAAHEIRNPLNTIGMSTQLLQVIFSQPNVNSEDVNEARDTLQIIHNETQVLRQTCDHFLALNRPPKLNLKLTSINSLITEVILGIRLLSEEARVKIVEQMAPYLPDINIDATLIRQVVVNLMQNGIQSMPRGGRLFVSTQLKKSTIDTRVVLQIRDTGVGIANSIKERIFDAYFTTRENEGGIGLGLAIAHQSIKAHQAQIEVQSQVGMGTTFTISFRIPPS